MTPITEFEWCNTYDPLETEENMVSLVSDTNNPAGIVQLFRIANPAYIWTQYDGEDDRLILRPGYHPNGHGWYVCRHPWKDTEIQVELDD